MGYCYLIHLDAPLNPTHPARHYLGYTRHLPSRMAAHVSGRGARFMQVARERGISWQIARTWPGDRTMERRLKNRKEGPKLCPVCRQARAAQQLAASEDLL